MLDFLRKYGYPIPEELGTGRPRVALLIDAPGASGQIAEALQDDFETVEYDDPIAALLSIGEHPPDAVVVAADLGRMRGAEIIEALKEDEHTRHVRAILLAVDDGERRIALEAGASAHVRDSDVGGLRDTLEALMGVRH